MTCGHPEHADPGEHESLEPIDDATFEALYAIFDDLVDEVMGELPEGVLDYMDNVVLFAEDEPPPEEPDILGVYDGIPLTERLGRIVAALTDTVTHFKVEVKGEIAYQHRGNICYSIGGSVVIQAEDLNQSPIVVG